MLRRLLQLALLLGSLAWAAVILLQADLPSAWNQLLESTSQGQKWLLLLAFVVPSGASGWLHACGWACAFGRDGPGMGRGQLFTIRLAGEAINQATPFMNLGGEPVKAMLFRTAGGSLRDGAAAVAAARWVMTLAQVLFVGLALALTLARVPPSSFVLALGVFPGLVGAGLFVFSAGYLLVPAGWRRAVMAHPVFFRFHDGLRASSYVINFWRIHPGAFWRALGFILGGCAAAAAEFWLVGQALAMPISWRDAVALEGLMNSVTMATFFIPGNLGSQEMGLMRLSALYSLAPPFGAVMVLLRRGREVCWIVVGLGCLGALSARAGRQWAVGSGQWAVEPVRNEDLSAGRNGRGG